MANANKYNASNSNVFSSGNNSKVSPSSNNNMTFDEYEMKKKVAPLLKLDPEGPWSVVSHHEGLVMVNANPDADEFYSTLRGVVVDLATGKIVSYAYPATQKFVTSSLKVEDNKVVLSDNLKIDLDNLRIKIGFEGTLIYVFKANGKVYRVTRKKLDPSRSRWGKSKTFSEMYWDLNGPTDEMLFSSDKDYSPYCHTFILVHPDVLVASKNDVGKGFIVYLGAKKMYSVETNCPYPAEKVDNELRVPELSSVHETSKNETDPLLCNRIYNSSKNETDPSLRDRIYNSSKNETDPSLRDRIYAPENLTVEEANKHLKFGFYEPFDTSTPFGTYDERILPGEFVILENLETGDMYRVESPAYAWRTFMRNNNPNLFHRFYELVDFSYLGNTKEEQEKYDFHFPILHKQDTQDVQVGGIDRSQNQVSNYFPSDKESKLLNIWMCMILACPVHQEKEVMKFYDEFIQRRNDLANWLVQQSKKTAVDETYSKRMKDILVKSKQFAKDKVNRKQNYDPKTKQLKTVDQLTEEIIRNFLSKEYGTSLYKLINEMKEIVNPPIVPKV